MTATKVNARIIAYFSGGGVGTSWIITSAVRTSHWDVGASFASPRKQMSQGFGMVVDFVSGTVTWKRSRTLGQIKINFPQKWNSSFQ